jgi:hypothetical protein
MNKYFHKPDNSGGLNNQNNISSSEKIQNINDNALNNEVENTNHNSFYNPQRLNNPNNQDNNSIKTDSGDSNVSGIKSSTGTAQLSDGPKSDNKYESNKNWMVACIVILSILVVAGGVTIVLLLNRGKGASAIVEKDNSKIGTSKNESKEGTKASTGKNSGNSSTDQTDFTTPEGISEVAADALTEKDYDKFFDLTSEALYQKIYERYGNIYVEGFDSDNGVTVKSGKDIKELYKNRIKESDEEGLNMTCRRISSKEISLADAEKILVNQYNLSSSIMDIYRDYDDFCIVEYEVNMSYGSESESERIPDICYNENGVWYSSFAAMMIVPAMDRYVEKSDKADDVCSAGDINTACSAALADEDAYYDIYKIAKNINDSNSVVIVAAAQSGNVFESINGYSIPTFIREVNTNLNNNIPVIRYKGDGQDYWSIGVSSDCKIYVYIGSFPGSTEYQLQPDICDEYK